MQQTQHVHPRCPVYLHPAAATNPTAVSQVQRATGQLIVLAGGRALLKQPTTPTPTHPDFDPFGGDAA